MAMDYRVIFHPRDAQFVDVAVDQLVALLLCDKPAFIKLNTDVLPKNLPITDVTGGKHDRTFRGKDSSNRT